MPQLAKVEGEVVTKDGTGQAIEFYECEFVLSDDIRTLPQARAIIRAGLITEYLRKNVERFRRVRTMQVMSLEPTQEKITVGEIEALLIKATELACVPENIDSYKRPDYKIKALEQAIEKAQQRNKKDASKKEKYKVEDQGLVD